MGETRRTGDGRVIGVGAEGGAEEGGGQKVSENFVTGEEGFVCWILEIVTISINSSYVCKSTKKCHQTWIRIRFYRNTDEEKKTLFKRGN